MEKKPKYHTYFSIEFGKNYLRCENFFYYYTLMDISIWILQHTMSYETFFLKNWPKTQFFNWDGNKVGSSMIEYKCDVGKEDLIWTKNVLTSSFNVNIYGYKNSYVPIFF